MTATPKETKYVSNIVYFGEPVYSYSPKLSIRDGFLAPYKVVKLISTATWRATGPRRASSTALNLKDANVLRIPSLSSLGTPVQFIKAFGGKNQFVAAVHEVQNALYGT